MTTALKPPSSATTSINIDIFRTLLAQWVIVGHVAPSVLNIPAVPGRMAVWCFFIISGFLNAQSFSNRLSKESWLAATRHYYISRAKRIYPLLILNYCVVSLLLGSWVNDEWYVFFPYLHSFKGTLSNSVLWTLVIEIQLYLLTPLLIIIAGRLKNLHWMLQLLPGLLLAYGVPKLHAFLGNNPDLIDDRTVTGNIGFYFFGMMLALSIAKRGSFTPRIDLALRYLLLIATVYLLYRYNTSFFGIQFTQGPAVAVLASFLVLSALTPLVASGHRIFRLLGYYTYEIYILHGLLAFIWHELKFTSATSIVFFWWAMPLILVLIFDVTVKKKYRDLKPQ